VCLVSFVAADGDGRWQTDHFALARKEDQITVKMRISPAHKRKNADLLAYLIAMMKHAELHRQQIVG
jgi:hypothetical protein